MMPGYVGRWTLFCPVEDVVDIEAEDTINFVSGHGAEIGTLESGIDGPLMLQFAPVDTAQAALELQLFAENVLQCPVMILPTDEVAELRKPFDWKQLASEGGADPWLSTPYDNMREILSDMAMLPDDIAQAVCVVSDHSPDGETYYLCLRDFDGPIRHAVWEIQRCLGRKLKQVSAEYMIRSRGVMPCV